MSLLSRTSFSTVSLVLVLAVTAREAQAGKVSWSKDIPAAFA